MDLTVYFLKPDCDEESIPRPMQQAYKILALETKPTWIGKKECHEIKEKKSRITIFVNDFTTPEFLHLESTGNRVYGPFCAISCYQLGLAFPRRSHPVFCMSMNDLVVCCTGIAKEKRKEYHRLVEYMGGRNISEFNANVTHLIAADTGSQKYLAAGNLNTPIMLPEWIEAIWKESQKRVVVATEEQFTHLKTPVFHKAVITMSGFDSSERARFKLLIEDAGGCYSGQMQASTCTHLITSEPHGKKYTYAHQWKIHVVTPQWLSDSVKHGYRQDETKYPVKTDQSSTSTPTKDTVKVQPLPDISCINASTISKIDETNMTMMTSMSIMKPHSSSFTRRQSSSEINLDLIKLKALDLNSTEVQSNEMFLDGCKIYVSGFSQLDGEKIKKLINLGGATRYSNINECVTHVIMGERMQCDFDLITKESFKPEVVSLSWLLDSLEKGHPDDELPHRYEKNNTNLKIDLPKKKIDSTLAEKTKPAPKSDLSKHQEDMTDILSQYLGDPEPLEDEPDPDMTAPPVPENSTHLADSTMETTCVLPFKGKQFIAFGLDSEYEELKEIITELGGELVQSAVRHVVDYAVVPLFGYPVNVTVGEVVSTVWINRCIEEQSLLSVEDHILYRPLTLATDDAQPLTGCVVTISGFVGSIRNCLHQVAESLGACVQDHLSQKDKPPLKASTHLLVSIPAGIGSSKYKAAVKWKMHIVREEWLYECAKTGKLIAEDKFPIENTDNTGDIVKEKENVGDTQEDSNIPMEHTGIQTPKPINQRVKDLMANIDLFTPPRAARANAGIVSPSQFLNPKKRFVPKFKFTPLLNKLKKATAVEEEKQPRTQWRRDINTPIGEVIKRSLAIAVANTAEGGIKLDWNCDKDDAQNENSVEDTSDKPLSGVVLCVGKKLSGKQAEYHNIAGPLGADYRWTYDTSVTHLIYQGRGTDKEYKTAKQQKKFIISQHWLLACKETNCRVDETLFPHNYNPNMSLSVSTPSTRPTRRSVRHTGKTDSSSDSNQDDRIKPKDNSSEEEPITAAIQPAPVQSETTCAVEETVLTTAAENSKVICQQMEDLINSTKGVKQARRKTRRINSFGQLNASSSNDSNISNESKSSRSKLTKNPSKENIVKEQVVPPDTQCEASQSLEVMWDDPTGRLEREKIADELERAYNPTQPNDFQFQPVFPFKAGIPLDQELPPEPQADRTVTPEPPSLTFPRPKTTDIPPPQPVELIEDVKEDNSKLKSKPIFLLSGISVEERNIYGALIEQLGGICLDSQHFDTQCTHLVIQAPTRNEKVLASIASGKWVLHKSYFQACQIAGHFVDECEHEWGSISTEGMTGLSKMAVELAAAAHRWRIKVNEDQRRAFEGWKVVLCCLAQKVEGFKRLLEAGGGTVLTTRPPYTHQSLQENCTHAFIESKSKIEFPFDQFVKAGVDCLKPEYIGAYLINDPPTNSYYINQIAASVLRHPSHMKRKGSDSLVLSIEPKKSKMNND